MKTFKCQLVDIDDREEWEEIEAANGQEAAELYAEICDTALDGSVFPDQSDFEEVKVRCESGAEFRFAVNARHGKIFRAQVL